MTCPPSSELDLICIGGHIAPACEGDVLPPIRVVTTLVNPSSLTDSCGTIGSELPVVNADGSMQCPGIVEERLIEAGSDGCWCTCELPFNDQLAPGGTYYLVSVFVGGKPLFRDQQVYLDSEVFAADGYDLCEHACGECVDIIGLLELPQSVPPPPSFCDSVNDCIPEETPLALVGGNCITVIPGGPFGHSPTISVDMECLEETPWVGVEGPGIKITPGGPSGHGPTIAVDPDFILETLCDEEVGGRKVDCDGNPLPASTPSDDPNLYGYEFTDACGDVITIPQTPVKARGTDDQGNEGTAIIVVSDLLEYGIGIDGSDPAVDSLAGNAGGPGTIYVTNDDGPIADDDRFCGDAITLTIENPSNCHDADVSLSLQSRANFWQRLLDDGHVHNWTAFLEVEILPGFFLPATTMCGSTYSPGPAVNQGCAVFGLLGKINDDIVAGGTNTYTYRICVAFESAVTVPQANGNAGRIGFIAGFQWSLDSITCPTGVV
jgi:hypothetical protein